MSHVAFNEWHIIPNAIDKKTCKKIIALGKSKFAPGLTNVHLENKEDTGLIFDSGLDQSKRKSEVVWLKNIDWIKDLIVPHLASANEAAGWKYDIIGLEALQLTRYKKDGFYTWHSDGRGCHMSAQTYGEDPNPYVRKLSMTVLLNDNYTGGGFEFVAYNQTAHVVTAPEMGGTGSIVIFPAYQEHRVAPIIKGIRYSLVAWFIGPPFK